jgi:DNA-binding transcriptional ArsR family regulator
LKGQEFIAAMDAPVFTALADPMRRKLLMNLAEGSPKTATQLAREYPISRQGILKHLHVLEKAGLVAVHQEGREKRYSLTPEPLTELEQWIQEVSAKWDQRLLRLKTMLENEESGEQAVRGMSDVD